MRFASTQIICFANQKGGCGKTSSAVSLAAAFAELSYKVCMIDVDPQCNASESFGVTQDLIDRERYFTLADVYLKKTKAIEVCIDLGDRFRGNLSIIPAHRGLGSVGPRLEAEMQAAIANADEHSILDADDIRTEQRVRLARSVESLRGQFDIVIIDTPPDLGFLMTTALIASDWLIIPVFPSGYDLKGLELLTRTVEKVRARYNPKLRLAGVLLGNFDKSAKLDTQIHDMLKRKFGPALVFETTISRSVRHREATINGLTIFEHARDQLPSEQYLQLVKELIRRGQKALGGSYTPADGNGSLSEVANG